MPTIPQQVIYASPIVRNPYSLKQKQKIITALANPEVNSLNKLVKASNVSFATVKLVLEQNPELKQNLISQNGRPKHQITDAFLVTVTSMLKAYGNVGYHKAAELYRYLQTSEGSPYSEFECTDFKMRNAYRLLELTHENDEDEPAQQELIQNQVPKMNVVQSKNIVNTSIRQEDEYLLKDLENTNQIKGIEKSENQILLEQLGKLLEI
ncbi:Hypothetical_protein [Hexamita inflata]|uniref:Hypothetical_protein n=1 Tax=Hexamita inflata TaxID=28002 RepID=A0AA86VPE9_9EUKA|nr:Hypothetical protein HINF_LOCUS59943 [Hexamita inflata]